GGGARAHPLLRVAAVHGRLPSAGQVAPVALDGFQPAAGGGDAGIVARLGQRAGGRLVVHELPHRLQQVAAQPDDGLVRGAQVFLRAVDDGAHADLGDEVLHHDVVEAGVVAVLHQHAVLPPGEVRVVAHA